MSFHFKPNEKLADGVRRIIEEQIDVALQLLNDQAAQRKDRVHETRKCFKRIRTVLSLVDFQQPDAFDRECRRYRNLGRRLARQRDADILPDVFDNLMQSHSKHLEGLRLNRERDFIISYAETVLAGEDFEALKRSLSADIGKAREEIAGWRLKGAGSVMSIVPSVVCRSFTRARDNFLIVCQNPSPERVHNWRKRVKDLLYQSELLAETQMKFSAKYRQDLEYLAQLLGEHHDLAVLYDVIWRHGAQSEKNLAIEGMVELIDMQQSRLESDALKLGGELLREDPESFVEHQGWSR